MDAIALLKQDHRNVEEMVERFEKSGEKAFKMKGSIIEKVTTELVQHMAVEEQLFYPMVRERLGKEGEEMALEALEEHHLVKVLLKELSGMAPDSERYEAKVTVLKEVFEHHVHEEEEKLFPMTQKKVSKNELADLGEELEELKKSVTTKPDPYASDVPTRRRPAERGRITATAAAARTGKAGKPAGKTTGKTAAKKTGMGKTSGSRSTGKKSK